MTVVADEVVAEVKDEAAVAEAKVEGAALVEDGVMVKDEEVVEDKLRRLLLKEEVSKITVPKSNSMRTRAGH
jgi:hypothetical protein